MDDDTLTAIGGDHRLLPVHVTSRVAGMMTQRSRRSGMVRCRGQEPTGPGFPSRVRARTKLRCCPTSLRTTRLGGPGLDAVQLLPKNVHHRPSGIFAPGKPLCRFPDLLVRTTGDRAPS